MAPILGVPLMDRDHAAIERLFGDVATTPDESLPDLFEAIARELAEHFAREEAVMTEARVPILLCHLELHAQLLREVERMRDEIASRGGAGAREILGAMLPQLVANHVATADTVSASFLRD
jgi:hemerythrin